MSRKDYARIAAAILSTKESTREVLGSGSVLKLAADRIATELEADNPRFSRERFLEAAGFPVAPCPVCRGVALGACYHCDADAAVVEEERASSLDGYVHSAKGTAALHRHERKVSKAAALVESGLAVDLADARAQLRDMGEGGSV